MLNSRLSPSYLQEQPCPELIIRARGQFDCGIPSKIIVASPRFSIPELLHLQQRSGCVAHRKYVLDKSVASTLSQLLSLPTSAFPKRARNTFPNTPAARIDATALHMSFSASRTGSSGGLALFGKNFNRTNCGCSLQTSPTWPEKTYDPVFLTSVALVPAATLQMPISTIVADWRDLQTVRVWSRWQCCHAH